MDSGSEALDSFMVGSFANMLASEQVAGLAIGVCGVHDAACGESLVRLRGIVCMASPPVGWPEATIAAKVVTHAARRVFTSGRDWVLGSVRRLRSLVESRSRCGLEL